MSLRRTAFSLPLGLLALALPATPASAGLYHAKPAACSFGQDGTLGSTFLNSGFGAIAFQQAMKRLYIPGSVNNSSSSRVDGFDASVLCPPSGYPQLPGFAPFLVPQLDNNTAAIAVDDTSLSSAGNLYISDRNRIEAYDQSGKPLPGFPIPAPPLRPGAGGKNAWQSLAVDPEGHVWAGEGMRYLSEFATDGTQLARIDLIGILPTVNSGSPGSIAFDAAGNLYIAAGQRGVWRLPGPDYDPDAAVRIDPRSSDLLTVDRASGDLYVGFIASNLSSIARFDPAGKLVESFPAPPSPAIQAFQGIAVDETSKAVYAFKGGNGGEVQVFQALTLPDVSTAALSDLAATSATLNGRVDPGGIPLTDCRLEVLPDSEFVSQANELQTLTIAGASGGTFTLSFESQETTALPYNASRGDVEAALAALPTIGSGDVGVTVNGSTYTIEFKGSLAGTDLPQVEADPSSLTPSGATATPATTRNGTGWGNSVNLSCEPLFSSISPTGQTDVSAPIGGLNAGEPYRFRLSAANENGTNATPAALFTLAQPSVETVGSPIRSATTARLDARLDAHGLATDYHFQYLSEAAYQANLAASQPPFDGAVESTEQTAEAAATFTLVSAPVSGLAPATTYRFRIFADNGAFGGAIAGAARSLTTRTSDQPFSHGRFPGPPGSDRAWEQVSISDSSGNPVAGAAGIAADGQSALYRVTGGTPISEGGTLYDFLYSHRPAGEHPTEGWRSEYLYPPREEAMLSAWRDPTADAGLDTVLALNLDLAAGSGAAAWRIPITGGTPTKIYEATPGTFAGLYIFSDDGSRAILTLQGKELDPAHPNPSGVAQLYDVSSGVPQMILLPGGVEGGCATKSSSGFFNLPILAAARERHLLSADGSRLYFPNSCSGTHLYMHDFTADATTRIDGPPISGPDCSGALIRSTPEAVYLWTQSRLDLADTAISGACDGNPSELTTGGDVYRYDLATPGFQCLTCIAGLAAANVEVRTGSNGTFGAIALAAEGPRLYFSTRSHLLPGAPDAGTPQIYRLDTETDSLAYVAPLSSGDHVSSARLSSDGRFLAFSSAAPGLDALTGSDNDGTSQAYLYDDAERSLVCASCPADGSPPRAAADPVPTSGSTSPNMTSLAEDGTLAFTTPTALISADQNTAATGQDPRPGIDVYEWRDGRALLVSDGITSWPNDISAPKLATISASGRDLFFTESAPLTPDALDGYTRLYDARIGGGIAFPEAPRPCPLEVCQGSPQGTPEEQPPGSSDFRGPGNPPREAGARRCPKGKVRRKGRCVPKARRHHRARHHRGVGR